MLDVQSAPGLVAVVERRGTEAAAQITEPRSFSTTAMSLHDAEELASAGIGMIGTEAIHDCAPFRG